jgi:hypothetical protein
MRTGAVQRLRSSIRLNRYHRAMGIRDRDWYREDLRKKEQLYWNERRGEIGFDKPVRTRRWKWPYRLRPDLPWWARQMVRQTMFWGAVALLYLAWRQMR